MRAAVVHAYGSAPALEDFDDPRGREALVVADVLAAGLNPVDLRIATGTFHGLRPEPPYVVGREGVVRLPDGRRAYLEEPPLPYGTAAERTLAHPEQVIPIPDGVDDGTAVALGVAGLAAWLPLEWRARVRPGERVLV